MLPDAAPEGLPPAWRPPPGRGFLTGYYEPEVEGALEPSPAFPAPLLARPTDLVTLAPGDLAPGDLAPGEGEGPLRGLTGARRAAGGALEPYPDRAAILDGALGALAVPVAHLRDEVEAFFVGVQGSARLRLPGGGALRVAYAGRNGRPYASLGRMVIAAGHLPAEGMTLARLKAWLRAHPAEGRALMRANPSYVFFRRAEELADAPGPAGGAGVPLLPLRHLAVDRAAWPYGLPVWIDTALPSEGGAPDAPFRRLVTAADTGSAIVGPARGDLFLGTGEAAGERAGRVRHGARFVVLWPRDAGDGAAP